MLNVATRSCPALAMAAAAGAGVADGADADEPQAMSPAAKHDNKPLVTRVALRGTCQRGTLTRSRS